MSTEVESVKLRLRRVAVFLSNSEPNVCAVDVPLALQFEHRSLLHDVLTFAPCLLHRLTFNPVGSHTPCILDLPHALCTLPLPWQRDLCNFHCCIVYIPSLLQLSALYFSVLSVICAYPSFTHYALRTFLSFICALLLLRTLLRSDNKTLCIQHPSMLHSFFVYVLPSLSTLLLLE